MAATAAGTELTEAHRRAQLATRASFLRELVRLWPLFDIEQLDESSARWITAVTDLILLWRAQSAQRALTYYSRFRQAETGAPLPDLDLYGNLGAGNVNQIRTSLLVTGPIGFKSRIGKGFTPTRARQFAFTAVAGAASRHVLNGGRSQLIETATKDEMSVGYARVTDADPCAFCAMLASRGPIYISRATAARTTGRSDRGAGEKYHDDCGCSVEPSFDRQADWPAKNRQFEKLWADTTAGLSGNNALNAFRRAHEAQRNPQTSQ